MTSHCIITIRPSGSRFTVDLDCAVHPVDFADQTAAEHFADGLALGLRLTGHTARIDLDIPDDVVAAGDIDFAMLDTPDTARPAKTASAPERDPVEARIERGHTANFYRAQHAERQGRGGL